MSAPERYGRVRIVKIKRAYDDLRQAVRAHDAEAAEAALDRYEQWADYAFGQDPLSDPRVVAMVDAVEAAMECRMIPSSTAADGGANRHVKAVHVADQLRAALAALRQSD